MTTIDGLQTVAAIGGTVCEGVCLMSLLVKRAMGTVVAFSILLSFLFASDLYGIVLALSCARSNYYEVYYVVSAFIQYGCELGVFLELFYRVTVRTTKTVPASFMWLAATVLIICLGLACYAVPAGSFADFESTARDLVSIDAAISIFRAFASILLLLWMSQIDLRPYEILEWICLSVSLYSLASALSAFVGESASRWLPAERLFIPCRLVTAVVWSVLLGILSYQILHCKKIATPSIA